MGVSDFSSERLDVFLKKSKRDYKVDTCYNPLTLEKVKRPKIIVSACRLDDKVKGGERTLRCIKEFDKYCDEHPDEHYLWLIFTNPKVPVIINSKNVILMQPRVDVRPFIAMADFVAQLSNDMETYCYTLNEALGYGVPVITTPLSIVKELPITDDMRIELNWDCSNVSEVVEKVFTKTFKPFKYNIPEDGWNKILVPGKSTYYSDKTVMVRCRIKDGFYDYEVNRNRKYNEVWETNFERAVALENYEDPDTLTIYHLIDIIN